MDDNSNHGQDDDAIDLTENEGVGEPEPEGLGEPVTPPRQPSPDLVAEAVAALEKERDELKDNMLRALAETDNVRKRANRQIEDARIYAIEKFARDLLAVHDHLQRAIDSVPAEQRSTLPDAVRTALEGVELTQKELVSVLARHGVTAIDASPGAAFDPELHQAVTQIPSAQPAGAVAQLFQSGWRIGDRTLRAAMVAVSAGPGTLN